MRGGKEGRGLRGEDVGRVVGIGKRREREVGSEQIKIYVKERKWGGKGEHEKRNGERDRRGESGEEGEGKLRRRR